MSDTDQFKEQLRAAEERISARKPNWRKQSSFALYADADNTLDEIVIKGRSHELVFEVLVLTAEARVQMEAEANNRAAIIKGER